MKPIRGFVLVAALAAGVSAACAQSAMAQPADPLEATNCLAQKKAMEGYLSDAFNERQVAAGALENGNPVTLYASRKGTWTLVELMPNGRSCVKASGKQMKLG